MIDNYDSFTYNLVQYFGELGEDVRVCRNDEISVGGDRRARARTHLHFSGPCQPNEAGVTLGADRARSPARSDSGRVPGAPGDRTGLRRTRDPCQVADAREDVRDRAPGVGVFAACRTRSPPLATISLPCGAKRCPIAWRSAPGPRTARSMGCAISRCRSEGAYSFIRIHCDRARTRSAAQLPDPPLTDLRGLASPPKTRKPVLCRFWPSEALTRCIEHRESFTTRCSPCGGG